MSDVSGSRPIGLCFLRSQQCQTFFTLFLHGRRVLVGLERAEDGVDAARGRDLHLVLGVVPSQVRKGPAALLLHARVGRVCNERAAHGVA